MGTILKTRKEHKCCYCNGIINKGELADVYKGRQGKFDKDDKQIGIEYYKCYLHFDINECRKNGAE